MARASDTSFRLVCLTGHLKPRGGGCLSTHPLHSLVPVITADQWWSKHLRSRVLGSSISYYDSDPNQTRSQEAVVFLHGNPTSSYLWRNIIPRVEGIARCLAPDLIGMGRSGKLPGFMYTFKDHYQFLCAWFESLRLPPKFTIVCHDWGSGLGLHWAYEHQDRVKGLVYMEAMLLVPPSLDMFPPKAQKTFHNLRSSDGEDMVIENNFFVEKMLPNSIIRQLHPDEMAAYREPYLHDKESRRPTLTWPREIPFRDSGPYYMTEIVDAYSSWLEQSSDLPKLYIDGEPGFFSQGLRMVTEEWKNQEIVKVKGLHFLQEDSPTEIGDAVKEFVQKIK